MWKPTFTILRKVVIPSLKENANVQRFFFTSKSGHSNSTLKITLVSASIGVLVGAGYGGYTHYKVNAKESILQTKNENFAFLKEAPEYKPQYRIINRADSSNLHLILFQYRTCPFCCKVRAYLDSRGISYEVVEVDAVLRQAIKWSGYKKVPILLAKVEGGYQQILDSTAIISVLETYLRDKKSQLEEVIKFYPVTRYVNDTGTETADIANKYFIMRSEHAEKDDVAEAEERKWRQWADHVLVHTLSPNVYRTPGEALETFKWFEEAGGWKQTFPAWECWLMVYFGAAAMWFIAKKLKARHHIKEDSRESLYDAANAWMSAIQKKGTPFLGGDIPNLADVAVYGVLSSIEGCQAFKDLRKKTEIGKWYDDISMAINKRMGKILAVQA